MQFLKESFQIFAKKIKLRNATFSTKCSYVGTLTKTININMATFIIITKSDILTSITENNVSIILFLNFVDVVL